MTAFGISWDYRCPASFVVHEHILDGLAAGADWDVTFFPYSLGQSHVEPGELPIWERPADDSGLEALQVAVVVRDSYPEAFLAVHRALFELRHVRGRQLDWENIAEVLVTAGIDPAAVHGEVASGRPLETVRQEHTEMVKKFDMWGVPTFVIGAKAVFVRLMERSGGDGELARTRIGRVLDLMTNYPELNEFKQTTLDH